MADQDDFDLDKDRYGIENDEDTDDDSKVGTKNSSLLGCMVFVAVLVAIVFFGFIRPARVKECKKVADSLYRLEWDNSCNLFRAEKNCDLGAFSTDLQYKYDYHFVLMLQNCGEGIYPPEVPLVPFP